MARVWGTTGRVPRCVGSSEQADDPMPTRTATDERRAKRRENERQLVAQAVGRLRSSEGWQAWLAARSRFHRYSLHNQLLIAHQHPGARRVAGFKAWLALGYCVRQGE